ncbi:mechanosensitive ion channel family protein [Thermoproteus tenax]|uniref:Uncharacterized protein n=1 Tax=Thermoproteus tenax (strain ATCC 35583 / DSM 2078 / JCM 9277 / NBRC 100435 / Kra 1) TaxID=768679 RepID=G4RN90_THETK|nr:hypothetical protein [Thermoproteus tenax]CCC81034.1 conserved hypothetical protein [Thermoproteus tenax Kra 1]
MLLQIGLQEALTSLEIQLVNAIPSIILFAVIVLIGYAVAVIVSDIIRAVLKHLFKGEHISVNLIAGAVKAFIILVALSIAFSVLNLGPAFSYVSFIANYLPYLAGAIVLITLGIPMINILVDYMAKQMPQDQFLSVVLGVLRFGLYAVIITIAATLAIFKWVPLSPYIFYDIIMASIVLLFSFAITDKAIEAIAKSHPDEKYITVYGRFVLYAVFILIVVGIITQPMGNVTAIIQTLAWGLAIAFALLLVPLAYAFAKKIAAEVSK